MYLHVTFAQNGVVSESQIKVEEAVLGEAAHYILPRLC